MKNSSPLIKALVVAGMVGTMAHISPVAYALTTAQTTQLGGNTVAALSAAATAILNTATSPADKERLAKEIAAYVAANKPAGIAAQVVKGIVAALPPASSSAIVLAAVTAGNSAFDTVLAAQMPEMAATIMIMTSGDASSAPAANTGNPNTNSTN